MIFLIIFIIKKCYTNIQTQHFIFLCHKAKGISKFIRLKLGDAFRFLVAHEQRHMIQARNTIKSLGITTDKFPVILEAARL